MQEAASRKRASPAHAVVARAARPIVYQFRKKLEAWHAEAVFLAACPAKHRAWAEGRPQALAEAIAEARGEFASARLGLPPKAQKISIVVDIDRALAELASRVERLTRIRGAEVREIISLCLGE